MSLTALLARCLLALALVANGLPAMAMPADIESRTEAVASAPCHDAAGVPLAAEPAVSSPTSLDCCDGGDCSCSCLHHAPLVLPLAAVSAVVPPHESGLRVPAGITPGPQRSPSLRPPIFG